MSERRGRVLSWRGFLWMMGAGADGRAAGRRARARRARARCGRAAGLGFMGAFFNY
jgi:hypothetical protein